MMDLLTALSGGVRRCTRDAGSYSKGNWCETFKLL